MDGKALQIHYSKEQLSAAFIELLKHNRYQEIPISEILDLAGISRRTFYRHFTNKKELLHYEMEKLIQKYLAQKDKLLAASCFEAMMTVSFEFWYQERELLQLFIRNQLFDQFLLKWNEHASDIYKSINGPWPITPHIDEHNLNYVTHFIVGGYYNLLYLWLQEENPEPPVKVAQDIRQMFQQIGVTF
ncbi:TetR/AcrR family transcriptional regulator [Streptococcus oricebi]|uniref:TetR/AcrR family transcriptional regulator n=1 Tax=Streptococcus oricebi TaxID=1547447 RepID=A0ABS5B3T4_9STRE|nr:TetR/AcrR family transcriptional regulator [Streptococcus oricebi]MBP2623331.1 TetR/AcrR family transcriptional regulator [Streptococcus oricebi]